MSLQPIGQQTGDPALDLAWNACGRVDAFYERGLNVWDIADAIKPIIASRQVVDPEKLADSSVDYADL